MVQKEKTKRGRPRSYDPEAARDSVLDFFCRAGCSASSLDDICEATGMNRPSVNAAFGDRRALHLKAIGRYRAISCDRMRESLAGDGPIRATLNGACRRALDLYYSGHDTPLGCFMVGAVISEAVGDSEIRGSLEEGLKRFDSAFTDAIRRAKERGEAPMTRDADTPGKIASSTLYYLATRSRAGEERAALEAFADMTIEITCA